MSITLENRSNALSIREYFTLVLPVLAWMILIFLLSHHKGDDSSELSEWVLSLLTFFHLDIEVLRANGITLLIRKLAHMTEYFVLACLSLRLIRKWYTWNQLGWACLIFCFLYACSDEYHQTFVEGRVGTPIDVIIDTFGCGYGYFFSFVIDKRKKRFERQ